MTPGTEVVVTLGGCTHQGVIKALHKDSVTIICAGRMVVTATTYVTEV